jgi:hypothetical protein
MRLHEVKKSHAVIDGVRSKLVICIFKLGFLIREKIRISGNYKIQKRSLNWLLNGSHLRGSRAQRILL